MGAGLFITSVVLATVLIASPDRKYNISKWMQKTFAIAFTRMLFAFLYIEPYDFMRDLIAYLLVLVIIVAVAYDGKVTFCLS